MGSKHEILILGQGGAVHPQLREALHSEGYIVHTIFDFVDAAPMLEKLNCPILLVDCGEDDRTSVSTVKAVIQNTKLHDYPLVLTGFGVNSFEKALDEYFQLATTIASPYKPAEITEAMRYIAKVYDRFFKQHERLTSAHIKKPEIKSEARTEAEESLNQEILKESRNVPEQLFAELINMRLIGGSLGGAEYTEAIDEQFLESLGYLTTNPKLSKSVKSIWDDVGKWGRNHLMRTCFVSARVGAAAGLSHKQQEQVKSAAFLFALAFAGDYPDLLKRIYYRSEHEGVRKELCSRVKDSAMKVAVDLANPELGNLISTMGKLIGQEITSTGDDQVLAASAIVSADLIDRICFQTGFWDPRAAYQLLRRCKREPFPEMHPKVWGCCMKLLSESIAANSKAYLLPKATRENPALLEQARKVDLNENEQRVPIPALAPGMRLSRALVAFDGREILASNIRLDEDLIWRIWQLAALRPLNAPVIVATEH